MKFKFSHIDLSACSMYPSRHMYTIYFVLESLITHLPWLQHYLVVSFIAVYLNLKVWSLTDNSSMFFKSFIFMC